ncbi:MAG TPA: shikimate kinase [Bacteroidia bacterium]
MMKLYIIGMPGAGKTHFGRHLAQSLNMQFKDLDEMLERHEGKMVKQIIEENGEAKFRLMEHETLLSTLTMGNHVISCGGGTPIYHNNIDWMKMNGIVIWLDTDLEIIGRRIAQNVTRRPLFMGLNEPQINEKLKELYAKRRKTYAKADVLIEVVNKGAISLNAVIQRIMKASRLKRK